MVGSVTYPYAAIQLFIYFFTSEIQDIDSTNKNLRPLILKNHKFGMPVMLAERVLVQLHAEIFLSSWHLPSLNFFCV